MQWLANWLTQLPSSLEIRDAAFQIKRVTLSQPPITYKKLLRSQAATSAIVQLNFLSPTTFRSKGSSLPFPVPRNVFQSYLRRWNDFSEMPYEADPFLDWIEANIHVHEYQLTARKVAVAKQGFITGFTGRLSYELKRTAFEEPDAIRLLHALLKFAAYCGTGYKTTFGLGRTVVECSSPPLLSTPAPQPESTPAQSPQPETALADSVASMQKIDALTQQFIARRKRQGGTRSLTAARTEAEIIIRHEAGESLIAIAQKMGKSYEAVKKAYTRAKQALPGQSDLNLKE